MSVIRAIKSLGVQKSSLTVASSTYRGGVNDLFFWDDKGNEHQFCYSGHNSSLKAYEKCPPLSAIINRKAQAHINGKIWVLNKQGKEAQNDAARKLRKLLANPNPLQSRKQFEAQQKVYQQVFGYCLMLAIIPAGFEKYGPIEATSLWNIPPFLCDIEESNKLFYQTDLSGIIKAIRLNYRGEKTDLPIDKICIIKDVTPSFKTLIFPESRIRGNEMPISNIITALESENEVLRYAGSQGIISPDGAAGPGMPAIPIKDPEKQQLQADFKRQYGIGRGQFRYIITQTQVKWQSMGTDPKKLMLIEAIEQGTQSLCDSYGYPPHLLGIIDPTFNNQNAAEKGLYQNTIIPEAESICEEWNHFFKTEQYGIYIDKDFSHLPILQEDKGKLASARMTLNQALKMEFDMGLITLNDWLVELGKDPLPDEIGNVRATDPKNSSVPLVITLGVGGVQALIAVLTAPGMDPGARQSVLEVVFGILPADAQRMSTQDVIEIQPSNQKGNGNEEEI